MKKMLKRGLSLVLALTLMVGLLPVTAFAAVDSSGRPTDLNNTLVLSIYTGNGFPGEPAVYGTSNYKNINSSFTVRSGATFATSATNQLDWDKVNKDIVQGAASGSTSVWGVYDANGTKDYFLPDASIIDPDNEIKMIRAVKGCSAEEAKNYEIIWYVIKLQHNPGSGWFGRATTEWHIDGVIKEKTKISINYYGNGNTSGNAPLGVTDHAAGKPYTVLDKNTMVKKINGVEVAFLGWSAKADGTGEEAGFYQPGDVITPTESISLYAMWDTTTQYTATVNTYLDGVLTSDSAIHETNRKLALGTNDGTTTHFYDLTESNNGVYTVKITGNGKFQLFSKDQGGNYTQIGTHQLTIYNQNGSLDVHHYSVTYDPNEGEFAADPGKQAYNYGDAVTTISDIPTKEGYRFQGWMYNGKLIQPGEEVTASIDAPITLTAQWEKTVNVTINVTVNHEGGGGYDQMASKDNVSLALVSRANDDSPYLEVEGKNLNLDKGIVPDDQKVTQYLGNTFTDMPGGTVDYTVVTSKSGYDTKITPTQDKDGNWIIDVVMTYNPSNFDLDFTVKIANSVPDRYIPDAAIVKVTFWSTDRQQWEIITQQEGGAPGVRVDFNGNRVGSGSYPVWKYESNGTTPYGYRIQITSFVYPDGTIVPASNVVTQDVAWTDNVYTATVDPVTGGATFGTLNGAYIGETDQVGELNAVITMDLHKVIFDAKGGKVNGLDSQTLTEQFKIPSFKDYVPTREGGYVFDGWYLDTAYTAPAVEGVDLVQDVTLYAKWIDPLAISGTVSIAGSYMQNGVNVPVNDIDRAMEAVVVLQEVRNGTAYEVDSKTVTFQYGEDNNAATDYSFTGIPSDGKNYQIHVLVLNYGTTYDNESDADSKFTANEYTAVFAGDNVADVDAQLTFVPPSYDQPMQVDATQINKGFRPSRVLAEVMYRDTGDIHPFKRISQHNVKPYGVQIGLTNGTGSGKQSIWKWHTDGTLYDYQMNISEVDGNAFNSDTAPYYITYAAPTYWDANANEPSGGYYDETSEEFTGVLKATLIPKQYLVSFDLNAGEDVVTGMDEFELPYTDEEGQEVKRYGDVHTWSFETAINAVPQREGYTFKGWETNVTGVAADDKGKVTVPADVHENVELTAKWEKVTYEVTAEVTPNGGGTVTGAGIYVYGEKVTLTATAETGYTFVGWKENGKLISNDTSYTIEKLTDNRAFVAEFSKNQYSVVAQADPENGGRVAVSGNGTYTYGEKATVTATENTGYTFAGWYRDDEKVSDELTFDVIVTENLSYVAKFEATKYTVATTASPAEGGTVTGAGIYAYGTEVIVNATAKTGYNFVGWYENETLVSEDAKFTFTVEGDRTLAAKFVETHTVKVIVTSGGTATGDGTYNDGETATVVATAGNGYKFMGWYEDGNFVDSSAEYSFVVKKDHTLKAHFAEAEHTITVTADPAEGGTVTGGGAYAANETATITAAAKSAYVFIGWYEDNKLVKEDASFSWTVRENRTLTARFVKKTAYRSDYVYLFGYNDTKIGATGPLLRGELAQMIYRLVKQNRPGTSNGGNVFSDTSGQWFQSGISYMASKGAIDKGSNAYPYASVTRGETYKMICLGLGFTDDTTLRFSQYARILLNHGYNTPEGSVNSPIVRYEFCALFNAILGRTNYELVDTAGNSVTHETYGYTDLDPSANYYRTMLIATSSFKNGKVDIAGRMDRNEYDYNG